MFKTSGIESAKPKKGLVGVGGGGRNRAELVGKHELDGSDNDGGGCSGDFNRKFHPLYDSRITHLDAQDEFINGIIN